MSRAGAAGLLAAALVAGLSSCTLVTRQFRVSGTITLAPDLRHKAPKENYVMFIVAKNRGNVPLAVKRIVNPQFPVSYTLKPEDLLVPGTSPRGPFRITVHINNHGNVGMPRKGDLQGECPDLVNPGERGAHIVVDKEV